MAREVICQYCKSQTNKIEKDKAIRIDENNFHPECAQNYLDKKELVKTICRIFNFKAPGPKNNRYIRRFLEEGMTYKGMTNSLIYFYDEKRNSTEKANDGIGIIPWVYTEAQKYMENKNKMEQKQEERIKKSIENLKDKKEDYTYVRVEKRERKQLVKPIEFTDPFEELEKE